MLKKHFFPLILLVSLTTISCHQETQTSAEIEIRNVLANQVGYWNDGNIENYMQGYWQNDSLRFIGKNGIQYGWKKTLENYKKSYPDKATMGSLQFDILSVETFSNNTAFVIGKWKLIRDKGNNIEGMFTLIFKNINKKWVIVCDHTS